MRNAYYSAGCVLLMVGMVAAEEWTGTGKYTADKADSITITVKDQDISVDCKGIAKELKDRMKVYRELRKGDTVVVTGEWNKEKDAIIASKVVKSKDAPKEKFEKTGKVKRINVEAGAFYLNDRDSDRSYQVNYEKVKDFKIGDIKDGDEITVQGELRDSVVIASKIVKTKK